MGGVFDVPDPRSMTDEEIATAGDWLEQLCRDIARVPEGVILGEHLSNLSTAEVWTFRFLRAGHEILKAEDERRTRNEVEAGFVRLEAFLEDVDDD